MAELAAEADDSEEREYYSRNWRGSLYFSVTSGKTILAAAAGGSLSEIETTVAMRAKDAHATFESAGKAAKGFRSAGRS